MTTLIDRISKTYDDVPYTSAACYVSAPEHMRAVAHLFGLETSDPRSARVLELGCAAGGNLIPFAVRHPEAEVVGIDLSPKQIDIGRSSIQVMGLKNIRLIEGSIADIGAEFGQFDYIVCHGVYSWVPEEVRDAILRVCNERLTPSGVAYVSYNTYPGWKAKEIIRDAMLLRAGDRAPAQERLAYARGMIEFLHAQATDGTVLSAVTKDNIATIRNGDDSYLSHEYLELCNAPCYFRDFVCAARSRGLEYLSDATVSTMFASNSGTAAASNLVVESGGDQVVLGQLLDFLQNRTFRQSLLVRSDRADQICYQVPLERASGLHVAGYYVPIEFENESVSRWRYGNGAIITVSSAATRAVLERLSSSWPATVPVAALLADAPKEHATSVSELVINLIVGNAVRFRLEPVLPAALSERPVVHGAMRALAASDETVLSMFTQWHEPFRLEGVERLVLPMLDGSVGIDGLVRALRMKMGQDAGALPPMAGSEQAADPLRDQVEAALRSFAFNAMLDTVQTQVTAKRAARPTSRKGRKRKEDAEPGHRDQSA